MRCPGCGLYHPPLYEQCVSCGTALGTADHIESQPSPGDTMSPVVEVKSPDVPAAEKHPSRRSKANSHARYGSLPTYFGLGAALLVLLVSAGATFFFLTKPTDDQRLFLQGQHELETGQYAFAVKTLEQVAALRPKDANVYLTLARAYVGVDQVEKAWQCISQAQQMGTGILADPSLASDLANYYRQHSRFDRAVELLRPLAQSNVPGKKAELADLDALWGDEALRDNKLDTALKCWNEVAELHDGTRFQEADARLATIYQKLADKMITTGNDDQALAYLNKLNVMQENARNLEMTAEIYERQGKLDLSIDLLRRALKVTSANSNMTAKLAALMSKRGKELLDSGEVGSGYGYLQQAQALDPHLVVPSVAVRDVKVTIDEISHLPKLTGQVWNAGSHSVNDVTLKVELVDSTTSAVLWQDSQKVVDEFVPPLQSQESKSFEMTATAPVPAKKAASFQVYLNGQLYKSYSLGQKDASIATDKGDKAGNTQEPAGSLPKPGKASSSTIQSEGLSSPEPQKEPPLAPHIIPINPPPQPAPAAKTSPPEIPTAPPRTTPEDKTMKDLDF